MGDPSSIGPEITVKAFASSEMEEILRSNRPFVVGDSDVLRQARDFSNVEVSVGAVRDLENISEEEFKVGKLTVLDLDNISLDNFELGEVSEISGRASIDYVEKAVELCLEEKIHGIVTCPINKKSIKIAGHPYPGHTGTLADLIGISSDEVTMMLVAGNLRVFHVTLHQSLKEAIKSISRERVLETTKIADRSLRELGIESPEIAVAGLNPHAGDGGVLGDEELEEIKPAVEAAREKGINASGPIPADTVFLRAREGEFDGVVAQYHNQGHIPMKLLGFMKAVNAVLT